MKPLYMWAGGKTKLIKNYLPLWEYENPPLYVEPFFGGGAVFGKISSIPILNPHHSLISDINWELIHLLKAIKNTPAEFIHSTTEISSRFLSIPEKTHRKEFYYDLREEYWNDPTSDKLYILMRLGFNGIWQTCKASNGLFGTPSGLLNHTALYQIVNPSSIMEWSTALQRSEIHSSSYDKLDFNPYGSVIYLDPPYRNSFTDYGTGFNDDDQMKLVQWAKDKQSKGATVLLANRSDVDGDDFFEGLIGDRAKFHYFDVTYTAGRRKKVGDTFEAKKAREFLAVLSPDVEALIPTRSID